MENWEEFCSLVMPKEAVSHPAAEPTLCAQQDPGLALALEENFPRNAYAGRTGIIIQHLPRAKAPSSPQPGLSLLLLLSEQ